MDEQLINLLMILAGAAGVMLVLCIAEKIAHASGVVDALLERSRDR